MLAMQEWMLAALGMAAMLDGVQVTKAAGVEMLAAGVEMLAATAVEMVAVEMAVAAVEMAVGVAAVTVAAVVKPMVA